MTGQDPTGLPAIRVERGRVDDQELAALVVALRVWRIRRESTACPANGPTAGLGIGWRRWQPPRPSPGFCQPGSWQAG